MLPESQSALDAIHCTLQLFRGPAVADLAVATLAAATPPHRLLAALEVVVTLRGYGVPCEPVWCNQADVPGELHARAMERKHTLFRFVERSPGRGRRWAFPSYVTARSCGYAVCVIAGDEEPDYFDLRAHCDTTLILVSYPIPEGATMVARVGLPPRG